MPNSDNTYGTYNKKSAIFSQGDVYEYEVLGDTDRPEIRRAKQVFADTTAAKNYYFTTEAQTVFDECCTNLQWALVNDDNGDATKLKVTFDFGTKGGNIPAADDWAGQFNSRKNTLIIASSWHNDSTSKNPVLAESSTDHLF